ncbi:uncharacterized protein LOC106667594 [Cimex lectularius]|uniref:MADF domain-containing protein n=1 Tax=Cimex lectularius TaxID=79782 RepID=A0A8I6RTK6_CIMLE|nr:uncharacterized protein LOC106667594 [Cimex lectularius]
MEDLLISEVSNYPSLYDQSLDTYKDSELKNKIWGQITAHILGGSDADSVEKVKTRWKSLRDSFLRNLKKAGVQGNKKIKPWKYSDQMQFLLPYIGSKGTASVKEELGYDDSAGTMNGDTSQDFAEMLVESDHVQNGIDERLHKKRVSVNERTVKRLKNHVTGSNYMKPFLSCQNDPIDSFFLGIAQTVKKLSPFNQAFIKKAIANLVIDTEINELEDSNGWQQRSPPGEYPQSIYEPTVEMKVPTEKIVHSSSSTSLSSYSMESDT